MSRDVKWRIISDYTGAGSFVLDDRTAIVGTDTGIQCAERDRPGQARWSADLGSRCLGVRRLEGGDLLASCMRGLFRVSAKGRVEDEKLFGDSLVHEAVPTDGGVLVTVGTELQFHADPGTDGSWRFDLRGALGSSIQGVRPVNMFACGEDLVVAVVDYDSGVGRVLVLAPGGEVRWMSEPGPLSDAFPAGDDLFVWCLTGYGQFESHLSRTSGKEQWTTQFAGVGTLRSDGAIGLIIGSNEAPEWDNWQYTQITAAGKVEQEVRGRGRASVRPCCGPDGTTYFIGYVLYLDPNSSRVDYTNYFRMPQELLFEHLTGRRIQIPEYDIFVQRVDGSTGHHEILHEISGSFSLARPRLSGRDLVFCDGTDIVAIDA